MNKKKIDNAILTLEVLIDCYKEDGTTYNAIKEWEALEVFKDLANRIDKAIEVINKMISPGYFKDGTSYMATSKNSEFGIRAKVILEILKGEE